MTISDHGTVTSYSMLLQTFLFLLILFLPLFFSSFSFLPYPYSLLSRRERNARWNVAQTYLHVSHAVSIFFFITCTVSFVDVVMTGAKLFEETQLSRQFNSKSKSLRRLPMNLHEEKRRTV